MSHQNRDYVALIRQQGYRFTPQRQMILDAICAGGGHTTPEEIYTRVHTRNAVVSRATVYRTVEFLCELRLVVAAQIGGQMYYEIAAETPHHHLVCRQCNTIDAISHAAVSGLFDQIAHERQFLVDMDHLTLFGLCRRCQRTAKQHTH